MILLINGFINKFLFFILLIDCQLLIVFHMFDNLDDRIEEKHSINFLPDRPRIKERGAKSARVFSMEREADFHIPAEKEKIKMSHFSTEERHKKIKQQKKSIFFSFFKKLGRGDKSKKSTSITTIKLPVNLEKRLEVKSNTFVKKSFSVNEGKTDIHGLAKDLDAVARPLQTISSPQSGEQPQLQAKASHTKDSFAPTMHLASTLDHRQEKKEELDVNLLPEIRYLPTTGRVIIFYALSVIFAFIVLIVPYIFLSDKNLANIKEVDDLQLKGEMVASKIVQVENQIGNIVPIIKKTQYIETLLDRHIYWSNFFPTLEQHTLPSIYFTGISVDEDLKVFLEGMAFDLRAVAEQLLIFKNSNVYHDIELSNLRLESRIDNDGAKENGIEFSLTFFVDESVIRDPSSAE
ncbi:hypothetical protein AUJ29_01565 [Candidatus Kuenenbacteria bacterium CG1_02_38_13]|uniref:PilN domain-containing protein n=1 Tax=Candidatus Kuenenbacteria bacterium CG1_02_38_13 TaxID=1805235 RepID=A0A1J4TYC1_9BACT|nr:MAG: hypothetical protein AUJ29_01565 [Candidatus Kuenenbacteria bacterium CG1_02_38_13]